MFAWFGSVLWWKQTFRYILLCPQEPWLLWPQAPWFLEDTIVENPTNPRSLGGNTKTCLNWPQTDERRKQGFHEKLEFYL